MSEATRNDEYRAKIEELMGWKPGDSNSFSMRAMQTFVRGKDSKFDALLAEYLDGGQHIFDTPRNEPTCPHGNSFAGPCRYCDVEADIVYDS